MLAFFVTISAHAGGLIFKSRAQFLNDYNRRLELVRQHKTYVRTWHHDLKGAYGVHANGKYSLAISGFVSDTRILLSYVTPYDFRNPADCQKVWRALADPGHDGFNLHGDQDLHRYHSLWQFTKVMQALGCGRTPSQAFWNSIR